MPALQARFGHCWFEPWDLFRISGFGFRVSAREDRSTVPPRPANFRVSSLRHSNAPLPIARAAAIVPSSYGSANCPLRILVAITGASGSLYAQRLLDNLDPAQHEVHVVLSQYAPAVIAEELPGGLRLPARVAAHNLRSMNAPFASGSNAPDAMVVIPCTMGTLGRIAHGYSEDVLLRAADVVLKEKRKLILVPRETPLNLIHVKNFELLMQAGATILPANPSFYSGPKTVEQVADTVVARVLDHLGVEHNLVPRWREERE